MKHKIISIFIFLLLCIKTNAQVVSANITQGCTPLTVNFSTTFGGPYYWDFADGGGPSNQQNPQRIFPNVGTYTVILRSSAGGPQIGTITITVLGRPTITLGVTPSSGCTAQPAVLTANVVLPNGVNINQYNWTYGDFTAGTSAVNTISHTYAPSATPYDVFVGIQTNMPTCDLTQQFPQVVSRSAPPSAAFSINPTFSCTSPVNVTITNNSSSSTNLPLTCQWDFGNGNSATTTGGQSPSVQTYNTSGIYTISLTATDSYNCTSSSTRTLTVGQPVASFLVPDTFCITTPTVFSPVTFTNTSDPGTYVWTFDGSAQLSGGQNLNTANPTVTYWAAGVHTISLLVITGSCSSTITHTVYVESPTATFTTTPSYSCQEQRSFQFNASSAFNVAQWDWILGDGTVRTGNNFSHTFRVNDADSIYVERGIDKLFKSSLTITTVHGCTSPPFSFTDTLHLPWARFMPDTAQGCTPLTVTFSDSSKSKEPIVSWKWNFGDGSPVQTFNAPQLPHYQVAHTYSVSGTYTASLIIVNSSGCTDTSYSIIIKVGSPKSISFTADKATICPGETITFTNTTAPATKALFNAWNYSSNGEPLSACYQNPNGAFVFDDSIGPQIITLTGLYNGCPSTATTSITVKGPIAHFTWTMDCATPNDVVLTDQSLGATGLTWDFGDGSSAATAGTFTHHYATTGDYTITLTATNGGTGCSPSKDVSTVHIRNLKSKFTSDTLLCKGITNLTFNASTSVDVFAGCNKGYTWIFSDPTKRPETYGGPIANLTFNNRGVQRVGLIVEDVNECFDTSYITIKVFKPIAKYAISDTSICFPATVQFTDQTNPLIDTTVTGWDWNFGDGSAHSFVAGPVSHTYNAIGTTPTYTTTFIVTDIVGCKDTLNRKITSYKPTSSISLLPSANICLGTPITFNATDYTIQGSSLSYSWNFGDGTALGAGTGISHTYANYTTSGSPYTVKMKYTEISSGCIDSLTQPVTVQPYPVATFTTDVDALPALCWPQQIYFTNGSIVNGSWPLTYNWNFGAASTTLQDPVYVFPKGSYTVSMVASTSNGCKDTAYKSFDVIGPEGNFTMSSAVRPVVDTICKCEAVVFDTVGFVDVDTYYWDFGDGSPVDSNRSLLSHNYCFLPQQGVTDTVRLILYGIGHICPEQAKAAIHIYDVRADFRRNTENTGLIDTATCIGNNTIFTNTSSAISNTFRWNLGDGTSSNSSTIINHTYANTGSFNVQLIAANSSLGCIDTVNKIMNILPKPNVNAISSYVCMYDTAYLSITNPNPSYSYLWTNASDLNSTTSSNPYNPNATVSETYTVTVRDGNNCVNSDTAHIEVIRPLQTISFDTTIVIGDSIHLPIAKESPFEHFTWNPSAGLSCTDCSYPSVQPLQDIVYTVEMKDSCTEVSGVFVIHVRPEMFITLPTTFTPNGDGTNDIIYAKGWGIKKLETFEIYNRWGELLFKTTDINEGWNGYYKGVLQNNDTYVYKLKANTWKDTELIKEGHFNLMR